MLVSAICGVLSGVILALTGAGGGVLATPLLVLCVGLSPREAAPVSLVAVALAAAVGAVVALRTGQVRYRAAGAMAMVGVLFAPVGLRVAHGLPSRLIVVTFCGVMLIVGARMLAQVVQQGGDVPASQRCACQRDPDTGRFRWTFRCSVSLACTGAVAGLFTGMLGVGGGFLIVPALRQFTDIEMPMAAATSLSVVALVSSLTAATTLASGVYVPGAGWSFIATTVLGLAGGRQLAQRVPSRWSQIVFSVLVFGVALVWLAKSLF
ncbi:sulfite exporter TauE/SafE family protein [Paraburkholderia tropica]|uniref:sulfite exporter TauE/SafE family protein n=1 Tax=Paraburkholderia tropica TaxID=92647 RepID=UPI003D2A44AC